MNKVILLVLLCFYTISCGSKTTENNVPKGDTLKVVQKKPNLVNNTQFDTGYRTIHVFVALCDNLNQGIIPVPEKVGNGQDPNNNLYWGAAFGVRSYFKKSSDWKLLKIRKAKGDIMERLIFKHVSKNYYLVADAYDGHSIKQCITDFFNSSSGLTKDTIHVNNIVLGIYGNSRLISYIGHDGLMEFGLDDSFINNDHIKRDCIILACSSKTNFDTYLKQTGAYPLVWTSSLMCPEAYTLHDAIEGYIDAESNEIIRIRAASAYSKYQKMNKKEAMDLIVSGW